MLKAFFDLCIGIVLLLLLMGLVLVVKMCFNLCLTALVDKFALISDKFLMQLQLLYQNHHQHSPTCVL